MNYETSTEKHLISKIINYYLEKNLVTNKKSKGENLLFNK